MFDRRTFPIPLRKEKGRMIRNYNIAADAQISLSKLQGGGLAGPMTGEVFWAATATSNAYEWLRERVSPSKLVTTIDEAVGLCTANRGDVIFVAPGYYEEVTAASQIDLDVAGISVIGLGRGSDMPELDFTNAAGELAIGAANVLVKNLNFHSNITAVLKGIDVEAAGDYFVIDGCWFDVETTTTDEFNSAIDIAAGANYGLIRNCYIDMGLGGAVQAIHFNGASTNHTVVDNHIVGDFSTANIAGSTAASTVLQIGRNILVNGDGSNLGAQPCIELNGNSTGVIFNNYCVCNLDTKAASIVAAQCLLFENYYNEDVSGAATGGIIGAASADD